MRKLLALIVFTSLVVGLWTIPVRAAGDPDGPKSVNWRQHDTAVYVVSTVNLLRAQNGHPLPAELYRSGVRHYEVYADRHIDGLYFIRLKGAYGARLGCLDYQMGWLKPMGSSALTRSLGVNQAPPAVLRAFRSDPKVLIGSFTSTQPS